MSEDTQFNGGDRWYVAQLRPNGLARAISNLTRQGFATFAPYRQIRQQVRGRWISAQAPLFPGYLFVSFDIAPGWQAINSTFGVARLLIQDVRRPAPLPDGLIAGLRARCDGAGALQPPAHLAVGDEVRILSGPFAEFVTRIEEIESADRVRVLLQMLGGAVASSIAAHLLVRTAADAEDGRRAPASQPE
jgi:transcriptional antiterminator RfaH